MAKKLNRKQFKTWVDNRVSEFSLLSSGHRDFTGTVLRDWIDECERLVSRNDTTERKIIVGDYVLDIQPKRGRTLIFNINTHRCAISHVHPKDYYHEGDKYDVRTGIAVAYAHYQKEEIPTVKRTMVTPIAEISNGEKFEFKPFRAREKKEYTFVGILPNSNDKVACLDENGKLVTISATELEVL